MGSIRSSRRAGSYPPAPTHRRTKPRTGTTAPCPVQAECTEGVSLGFLDTDLAALYGVPVKRLNEQVRRSPERFPEPFMSRLTTAERERLRSQIATSTGGGGRR